MRFMEHAPAVTPKYTVLSVVLGACLGEQAKKQLSRQQDSEAQESCNAKLRLAEHSKAPWGDGSKIQEMTTALGH